MSEATTIPEIRQEAVRDFLKSRTHLYVLARDGGCEGHSAPLQVFLDEQTARAAVALARAVYGSGATVYPVPVWPQAAVDDPKPLAETA